LLLVLALIVILTLGALTVFGEELRGLLDPAGSAGAGPGTAAWPVATTTSPDTAAPATATEP
jgi:hypothetical protein